MTIRHMTIFVEVYRTGSITRAAENLYMTQPAVTRSIQELEKHYGIRLFERINQRLSVTEAGKRFYTYALHIIDSYEQMENEMKNWDEFGVIRIGASVTLGSMLLPKILKEFQLTHPGITVKAMVENDDMLRLGLENNELDFALIEGIVSGENLIKEAFSEDRLVLLLPPDSPLLRKEKVHLRELQDFPLLLRDKESLSRILIDHIYALHHLPVNPLMESISTHAIVQSVHEGLGISFLPERLVKHSIRSGFIASRPIDDEKFTRTNYIVRHKNKMMTKAAQDLFALCHELSPVLDL